MAFSSDTVWSRITTSLAGRSASPTARASGHSECWPARPSGHVALDGRVSDHRSRPRTPGLLYGDSGFSGGDTEPPEAPAMPDSGCVVGGDR